jgi:hypothetical protein
MYAYDSIHTHACKYVCIFDKRLSYDDYNSIDFIL